MLLFIISEVMVFGAFFTAYFFIRVVNGRPVVPASTATSCRSPSRASTPRSCCLVADDALGADVDQERQPLRAEGRASSPTFLLGLTFLFIQINEYIHIGFAPQDFAQASIFYGLTGLHGAHVFIGLTLLLMVDVRAFRGHFTPEQHRGVEVPGIYWHFVDIMWVVVYTTIYII